ncbi:MAG: c-type cytochrome, partial [Vulcanimicrobiaceae bacterium]
MKSIHTMLATALGGILLTGALAGHSGVRSTASAAPDGKALFETNCSTCHGSNGKGQPNVFPPLAGNHELTAKDPTPIIKIVLEGLNIPKTIEGKQYSGGMPSWKQLSDGDIAAIITYERSAWGNTGSAITHAQVA